MHQDQTSLTGQEARRWRRALGIRIIDLHLKSGVAPSALSEWERSLRSLPPDARNRIFQSLTVLEAEQAAAQGGADV